MGNDYSRSFGAAGDAGNNTRGRQLMHQSQNQNQSQKSRAPVAGVSTAAFGERRSAPTSRRNSGASHHSNHSAPYPATSANINMTHSLSAGPGANEVAEPHRPGRQLPAVGSSHIGGLPDRASWTTSPGSAAAASQRALSAAANASSSAAPTSLAAAVGSQNAPASASSEQRRAQVLASRGSPPVAGQQQQLGRHMAPSYSKEQLVAASSVARAAKGGAPAPKSLREQLMGRGIGQ